MARMCRLSSNRHPKLLNMSPTSLERSIVGGIDEAVAGPGLPDDQYFRRLIPDVTLVRGSGDSRPRPSSAAFRHRKMALAELPAEAQEALTGESAKGTFWECSVNWGARTSLAAEVAGCGDRDGLGKILQLAVSEVGGWIALHEENNNPAHCRLILSDRQALRLAKACILVHTPPAYGRCGGECCEAFPLQA